MGGHWSIGSSLDAAVDENPRCTISMILVLHFFHDISLRLVALFGGSLTMGIKLRLNDELLED